MTREPAAPTLSREALRVLRAGAVLGVPFTAEDVGRALGIEPVRVLEALQDAVDAGVPVEDRGGAFALPEELVASVKASVLPSLANAWKPGASAPVEAPAPKRGQVRPLLASARRQWLAAGPDGAATLQQALATADRAIAALGEGDPADLEVAARVLAALIAHDIGDEASLRRAAQELAAAGRIAEKLGDRRAVARLFNDQASVLVRLGDLAQARQLLASSRTLFTGGKDVEARREMAETDALLARMPLHDASTDPVVLAGALEHGRAAAKAFRELGAAAEAARADAVVGRLEIRAGRRDEAMRLLGGAAEFQSASGDVLGLAATTAALSELLASEGRAADAARMLAQSISLNAEKGSAIGLAYNRRDVEVLGALPGARAVLKPLGDLLEQAGARVAG
jgi:tetratricopeptide (TPR) repeat protein